MIQETSKLRTINSPFVFSDINMAKKISLFGGQNDLVSMTIMGYPHAVPIYNIHIIMYIYIYILYIIMYIM